MKSSITQRIHCLCLQCAARILNLFQEEKWRQLVPISFCMLILGNYSASKRIHEMKLVDLVRKSSCNWRPFLHEKTERNGSHYSGGSILHKIWCGIEQRHFLEIVSTRVLGILVAGTTTCPGRESQDPCEYRSVLSCEENFSRINCCNVILQSINSTKNCDLENCFTGNHFLIADWNFYGSHLPTVEKVPFSDGSVQQRLTHALLF